MSGQRRGAEGASDVAAERISNVVRTEDGWVPAWREKQDHDNWLQRLGQGGPGHVGHGAIEDDVMDGHGPHAPVISPGANIQVGNDVARSLGALWNEHGQTGALGWMEVRDRIRLRIRHAYVHGFEDGEASCFRRGLEEHGVSGQDLENRVREHRARVRVDPRLKSEADTRERHESY